MARSLNDEEFDGTGPTRPGATFSAWTLAYLNWVSNPKFGRPRAETTLKKYRAAVRHTLRVHLDDPVFGIANDLGWRRARWLREKDLNAYEHLAAWREFLAFITAHELETDTAYLPRSCVYALPSGALMNTTLGPAVRALVRGVPPHALATMRIGQSIELFNIAKREKTKRAIRLIWEWGWGHACLSYGELHDFSGEFFFPEVPGGRSQGRPAVIADVASRRGFPGEQILDVSDRPPLFYWRDNILRALMAARAPVHPFEQLRPTNFEIMDARELDRDVTWHADCACMASLSNNGPFRRRHWNIAVNVSDVRADGEEPLPVAATS
jgi:hypothetical protein